MLVLDDRTRDLIEGRRAGTTHRRGWIVRRSLVVADVVGILAAFAAAEMALRQRTVRAGRFGTRAEIGLFVALAAGLAAAREDLRALRPRRGARRPLDRRRGRSRSSTCSPSGRSASTPSPTSSPA